MHLDNAEGTRETGLYEIVGLSDTMNISAESLWEEQMPEVLPWISSHVHTCTRRHCHPKVIVNAVLGVFETKPCPCLGVRGVG